MIELKTAFIMLCGHVDNTIASIIQKSIWIKPEDHIDVTIMYPLAMVLNVLLDNISQSGDKFTGYKVLLNVANANYVACYASKLICANDACI